MSVGVIGMAVPTCWGVYQYFNTTVNLPFYMFIILGVFSALFMFSATKFCGKQDNRVAFVGALAFGTMVSFGGSITADFISDKFSWEHSDPTFWVVACACAALFIVTLSFNTCGHKNSSEVVRTGAAVAAMILGGVGVAAALLVNLDAVPSILHVPDAAHVPIWVGCGVAGLMLLGGLGYCVCKRKTISEGKCWY